jgi:hypothetical protein
MVEFCQAIVESRERSASRGQRKQHPKLSPVFFGERLCGCLGVQSWIGSSTHMQEASPVKHQSRPTLFSVII